MIELPALPELPDQVRWLPIIGDAMQPTFRQHTDAACVTPVDRYEGEGVYVVQDRFGNPDIVRVGAALGGGTVRLSRDNHRYESRDCPLDQFNAIVLAKVIGRFSTAT